MIDLSVVILSFNTRELLRDCLRSLMEANGRLMKANKRMEVFVVDNNSSDGSAGMVETKFPWVNLIGNKENVGFARANNQAIPKTSGKYILFLGPDGTVPENTLPEMLRLMDGDPKIGAATCKVVLKIGGLDIDCHRGFPTPWASFTYFAGLEKLFPRSRIFGQYHQTWKDLGTTHEIDVCLGHFMLVRREAAEAVALPGGKWWDEDFFFYGEDVDFCYRLKEAGWEIVYHPKVEVLHYKGASSGIRRESRLVTKATEETKKRILKSSTEAMWLFYKKHYKDRYPRIVTALVFAGIWVMKQVRLLSNRFR